MDDRYDSFGLRLRMDSRVVAGFSTISTLKPDNDRIDYRSAAQTDVLTEILVTASFDSVLLERGIMQDAEFEAWAGRANTFDDTLNEAPNEVRRDILVEILSRTGEVATVYKIRNCWVSELCVVDGIDTGDGSIAIERLRLENEGWEQVSA